MTRLFRIVNSIHTTLRKAPGPAVVVQTDNGADEGRELEYYQLPGVASGPTPEDLAVAVHAGAFRVVVASHNYRLDVPVDPGELRIYSTSADGDQLQADIRLQPNGKIVVANQIEDLAGLVGDLLDELIGLSTTGSPTTHVLSPAVIANLTAIKLRFEQLLEEK
jgi:hypothetical protein